MNATETAAKPETFKCIKCDGSGKLRHFMHIDNGRCFMCAGSGTLAVDNRPIPVSPARKSDPAHELRNLYRAARSQVEVWEFEEETGDHFNGPSCYEYVRAYMRDVPADVAARALDAFCALSPVIARKLTATLTKG